MTQDVTFLQKSYGEYTQVVKPVVVTMCYEGLDDKEEELDMVPVVNNTDNSISIVSDSNSDVSEEDIENSEDNIFDEDVDNQVKISPHTTVNAKVV